MWYETDDGTEILITDFHDERNRLDYWNPILKEVVPTPETFYAYIKASNEDPADLPKFDEHEVAIEMRGRKWEQAFVRTVYSSAKVHPRNGSHIPHPTADAVRDTVSDLIGQHIMTHRKTGGRLAIREWLDLKYCPQHNPGHYHPNEVRYFIRDGEVLYHFPEKEDFIRDNMKCEKLFSYVREDLENGIEYPHGLAEKVAEEFTDIGWHVDFVRHAKTGSWYCVDMGTDGVYWDDYNEEWVAISEHKEDSPYNPERYADELPKGEI